MNYIQDINGKTIKIDILENSTDILAKKKTYLRKTYKGRELDRTMVKLKSNKLNHYILIRVLVKNRLKFRFEELYKVSNKDEWIETLTLMFQNQERYEICEALLNLIK